MARAFFEDVADALVGFLPASLRAFSHHTSGRNLKVWYGDELREHYEAQLISRAVLRTAKLSDAASALEVGFHVEHPDRGSTDAVVARLAAREKAWRRALGRDAMLGPFIGRASTWARLSELWDSGDITGAEAAIEAADRLATYIKTIEPIRRQPRTEGPKGA